MDLVQMPLQLGAVVTANGEAKRQRWQLRLVLRTMTNTMKVAGREGGESWAARARVAGFLQQLVL